MSVTQFARRSAIAAAAVTLVAASVVNADFIPVYGGGTYDTVDFNGFTNQGIWRSYPKSTASGIGISYANSVLDGTGSGTGVQRVTPSGAEYLGSLGTSTTNTSYSLPYAISSNGTIAGFSTKYDSVTHADLGIRPAVWAAGSTAPLELQVLGTYTFNGNNGVGKGVAFNVAANGTALGFSTLDLNVGSTFSPGRDIPVKWDAAGNVTALSTLGYTTTGSFNIYGNTGAQAMNSSGIIIGNLTTTAGSKAARWDAAGNGTELLPVVAGQSASALAINDSGKIVGRSLADAVNFRSHATVWNALGQPTELAAPAGVSLDYESSANSVNAAGLVVGYTTVTSTNDTRAMLWKADGTPVVLGTYGLSPGGTGNGSATDINTAGLVVGSQSMYVGELGFARATIWRTDGVPVDLNTLIDPLSGWVLTSASGLSDDNWVSGLGSFDPDGSGPLIAYTRAYLIQVPESALVVPEPAATGLLAPLAAMVLRRNRRA